MLPCILRPLIIKRASSADDWLAAQRTLLFSATTAETINIVIVHISVVTMNYRQRQQDKDNVRTLGLQQDDDSSLRYGTLVLYWKHSVI